METETIMSSEGEKQENMTNRESDVYRGVRLDFIRSKVDFMPEESGVWVSVVMTEAWRSRGEPPAFIHAFHSV